MHSQLRPALVMMIVLTVITGLIYPLTVTGIAQLVFPHQSSGSLVSRNGQVIGSELIGQSFATERYFHGRPSATSDTDPRDATKTVSAPYNAANSAGSNLGPTSKALVERVQEDVAKRKAEGAGPIPVDLVTTSASGLDPHISPEAALFQVARVAKARNVPEQRVRNLVGSTTEGRLLGILGEPRVNVLQLNIALDGMKPG